LAQLRIDRAGEVEKLMLDTKDLEIKEVKLADGKLTDFKLHTADPILGSALEITLDEKSTAVTVKYTTSAEAEALQWLEASQTADKEHPFLFTSRRQYWPEAGFHCKTLRVYASHTLPGSEYPKECWL
jgi:aminopeptidase N